MRCGEMHLGFRRSTETAMAPTNFDMPVDAARHAIGGVEHVGPPTHERLAYRIAPHIELLDIEPVSKVPGRPDAVTKRIAIG